MNEKMTVRDALVMGKDDQSQETHYKLFPLYESVWYGHDDR